MAACGRKGPSDIWTAADPAKLPALKMMDEIGMTPAQRAKVMGGNAARLLKLN